MEAWGTIILAVTEAQRAAFIEDAPAALKTWAASVGVKIVALDAINKVEEKDGYVGLSFGCADWAEASEAIVSQAEAGEYYAYQGDEYGCSQYFALTKSHHYKHSLRTARLKIPLRCIGLLEYSWG